MTDSSKTTKAVVRRKPLTSVIMVLVAFAVWIAVVQTLDRLDGGLGFTLYNVTHHWCWNCAPFWRSAAATAVSIFAYGWLNRKVSD